MSQRPSLQRRSTLTRTYAILAVTTAITTSAGALADDNPYEQLLDDHSTSIVTVKFVMNVTMGGAGGGMDREIPVEIDGIVVSDDGLIMIPGGPMDMANQMRRQFRGRGRGGRGGGMDDIEIEATPTDIRVVMGADFDEYDAVLAAKDSALNLAFVMLEETKDLDLAPITFNANIDPQLGEELLGLRRLSEDYDYAPYFGTVRVTGRVTQPRPMWCISAPMFSPGVPVFNHNGAFIGVMSDGSTGGDTPGAGVFDGGAQLGHPFLVPAKQLAPIIKQAHERGKEVTAEEAPAG